MLKSPPCLLALLVLLVSVTAIAAPAAPPSTVSSQATPSKGLTKGLLRVIEVTHSSRGDAFSVPLELQVYRVADGVQLQHLEVEAQKSVDYAGITRMEFLDLNDDNYEDLVVFTGSTGTAGASYAYDVFIWAPQLERFVLSKTLSQMGELAKNKRRGCVDVTSKCSSTSYNTTTYCFQKAKGTWREQANNGCPEVSE